MVGALVVVREQLESPVAAVRAVIRVLVVLGALAQLAPPQALIPLGMAVECGLLDKVLMVFVEWVQRLKIGG
jgi:hypothetical protein